MRRVRLERRAFINGSLYDTGSVIDLADDMALAPYMTELTDALPSEPVAATESAPEKTVTVHYHPASNEVDIDVDGVGMHVDHAALKIETD